MSAVLNLHSGIGTAITVPGIGDLLHYGNGVPNSQSGLAPGCVFVETDAGRLWINTGTALAAAFEEIGAIAADEFQNIFIGGGGESVVGDTVPAVNGVDNISLGAGSVYWDTPTALALESVTSGLGNVAIGGSTLTALTTSNLNVGIGENVMPALTTGAGLNVVVGAEALLNATTADTSVALGYAAGAGLTTGSSNTFLGNQTTTTKADLEHGIAIGSNANVINNNQCVIGGTGGAAVSVGWSGTTAPADADIVAGQFFIYWDSTNGASKLKIKGKSANGTVVTGEVALA